jgi:hypothetical protein
MYANLPVSPSPPPPPHTSNHCVNTQARQEELVAQVDKDLRTMLLKPDAPQPRVVGVRVWPRAIPQFNIGHSEKLDKAKQVGFWAGLGEGGGAGVRRWCGLPPNMSATRHGSTF